MTLKGRDFISTDDFSREELQLILQTAQTLKKQLRESGPRATLPGKTLAMIFQKPSNRTRVSFEIGMHQLGGHALYIAGAEIGMGEREPIADIARVMSRYVDAVMIRSNFHSDVLSFAENAAVPVINGLSDLEHPCQAMADMLTVLEHRGTLDGVKVCYIGDGNNVCNSLISVCQKLGLSLTVSCPKGYEPQGEHRRAACQIVHDPHRAIEGADVVYTDTWTSMGQEDQSRIRRRDFAGFTIDSIMFGRAKKDAIFMHCLPAHRGEEVEDEIMESPRSVIFDQAENRLHAQKAVIALILAGA